MAVLGHWVWLSRLQGISPRTVSALLDYFGSPLEIYNAKESDLSEVPGILANEIPLLLNRNMRETEEIIERCQRLGISILTKQDAAYPERLNALYNPPAVLYFKGKLPAFDSCPAISIVGARNASLYGLATSKKIAFDLARAGVIIVSGMALGCDGAAHSGAIEAGKPTVAVLGCGVDICYPNKNRLLYNDIPRMGAIISEYPPGTRPYASNFPARNRIISGLSNGVLVTEASLNSGSLITVDYALDQGREVYAIPGNIDFPLSAGTNNLIKQGAKLITSADDILCDLHPLFSEYFESQSPEKKDVLPGTDIYTQTKHNTYSDTEKGSSVKLYRPVFPSIAALDTPSDNKTQNSGQNLEMKILELLKNGDMYHDDIILALGSASSEVNTALSMLEINGQIKSKPGDIFSLA